MKYEELITDQTIIKDIKCGAIGEDGLANYLIRTLPVAQIAKLCAIYIFKEAKNEFNSITITEEEFKAHFRIRGWKEVEGFTGTKETRGHFSKK